MNNANTKLAIVVSLVLGGGLGYFIASKLLKEKYEEEAQMDIDDVKAYFKEKYGVKSDEQENYRKVAAKYTKPDLHELANAGVEDEEIEEDQEVDEEKEAIADMEDKAKEADPNKEPYLIDYQTFSKPSDVFDKISLYYYRFDDVVCNADDSVIEEPETILGWEYITELGRKTTVFVRNEKLRIDYEIHSFSKSYDEEVKVKLETDTERKYRRMARQKKAIDDISTEYAEEEEEELPVQKQRSTTRSISSTKKRTGNHKVSTKNLIEEELEDEEDEEDE